MNIHAALLERARQAGPLADLPLVRGKLFPVLLRPDPITTDCLTIGVAFVDQAGVTSCRLIDSMKPLQCLYGRHVDVASFTVLRDIIAAELEGTIHQPHAPTPSENIEYGTAFPAADISVKAILERAFATLVPMAVDKTKHGTSGGVLTSQLRLRVQQRLRNIHGPQVEALFQGGDILIPGAHTGAPHRIRLPLHDASTGRAGSIISAFTFHHETAERNLTEAIAKLLAIRLAEQSQQLGLFVLEPSPSDFQGRDTEQVRARISNLTNLLGGANVNVQIKQQEQEIATAVWDWYKAA